LTSVDEIEDLALLLSKLF